MASEWLDWYYTKPPISTIVWGKWSLTQNWVPVRTCPNGCCVSDAFGAMQNPNFWKSMTPEEQQQAEVTWQAQRGSLEEQLRAKVVEMVESGLPVELVAENRRVLH